jgi:hypothetical protein
MNERDEQLIEFKIEYNKILLRGVHVALNSVREYLAKDIVIDNDVLREIEKAWQRGFGKREVRQ